MRLPNVRAVEKRDARRGAAAVELAMLLPVLVFCSMMTVDFARIAYVQVTLQNCARNGALYEFYTKAGFSLPAGWTSLSAAASADGATSANGSTSIASDASFSVTATSPGSSHQQLCHGHGDVRVQTDRPAVDVRVCRRCPARSR